jgi:cytochrome c peroxidase
MQYIQLSALLCATLAVVACTHGDLPAPGPAAEDTPLRTQAVALFGQVRPVEISETQSPAVQLGRALYWDTRLSLDGKTACASCHARSDWSSDRRPLSINAKGQPTTLHSQPMFMAQDQVALRWYGDRKDGAHQAERSITGSMGLAKADDIVPLLRQHGYAALFEAAYGNTPDAVSPANYGRALQAYQRTLRTPAPFDRFLAGEPRALDALQLQGLQRFVANGCAGCHSGPLLGGNSLQKFGVVKDYWLATGSVRIDEGRFNATRVEADRYVYRVPMLRNIAQTAPYFHDASVPTLERAVRVMAEVQLGRELPDGDVKAIVAFLGSLTGAMPPHYAPPDQWPALVTAERKP